MDGWEACMCVSVCVYTRVCLYAGGRLISAQMRVSVLTCMFVFLSACVFFHMYVLAWLQFFL